MKKLQTWQWIAIGLLLFLFWNFQQAEPKEGKKEIPFGTTLVGLGVGIVGVVLIPSGLGTGWGIGLIVLAITIMGVGWGSWIGNIISPKQGLPPIVWIGAFLVLFMMSRRK